MNAVASPYLNADEATTYLRLGSTRALRRLIREHHLPYHRRGSRLLFDTRELDAWIHGFNSAIDFTRAKKRA